MKFFNKFETRSFCFMGTSGPVECSTVPRGDETLRVTGGRRHHRRRKLPGFRPGCVTSVPSPFYRFVGSVETGEVWTLSLPSPVVGCVQGDGSFGSFEVLPSGRPGNGRPCPFLLTQGVRTSISSGHPPQTPSTTSLQETWFNSRTHG